MKRCILFQILSICTLISIANAAEEASPLMPNASSEWRSLTEPLLSLGERMAPLVNDIDDSQLRHEMYEFLFAHIAHGYVGVGYSSPEHPDFWPYLNIAFNNIDVNPDDMYYATPIDGKGVYRLSGYRGTVKIVDISPSGGNQFTRGDGSWGQTYANYNPDDLKIDRDGYFEVLLSNERPAGYKGNWWKLDPDATYINIRQIASDWMHEVDARLAIERLDKPVTRPRPTPQEIETNLKQIAIWAENWAKASLIWLKGFQSLPPNTVALKQYNDLGGVSVQTYIYGRFDLAEDEALIYEAEVPKRCRYWAIQLTDNLFRSIDWVTRQTSLNGYTGKVDKDGKFRAVIAATDPGVPNWLDDAGYKKGAMFGRWHTCSSTPTPTITKVRLADVRKYLPPDTPIVSAEEREAIIRLRQKAYQLRRKW